MVGSICPWEISQEFLTGKPSQVGVVNWKLGGTSTTQTSESNMAAQHISSSKTVVIYCLLALLFVCFSIYTLLYNLYLWNNTIKHNTSALSVQNTMFF